MGTNYYLETKCSHCQQVSHKIHLGKSSGGWTFTFKGDREAGIVDFKTWLDRVDRLWEEGYIIVNEYDEVVIRHELLELINSKKSAPNNHALYVEREYPDSFNPFEDWTDSAGNSFSDVEFS